TASVWLPQLRKLPPAGARIVLLKWMGNCSETCRKNCPLKGLAPVFGVEPHYSLSKIYFKMAHAKYLRGNSLCCPFF
ncbi:hypothetical protein, partial [Desulfovibrio legallii]|uniref:hypothetical protein n=1 Tax=Desulfovibrio legallii TaxID=571438 RepID=UPI001A939A72